jgi:hypothetical protein
MLACVSFHMELFHIERGFYSRTEIEEREMEGKTAHTMNFFQLQIFVYISVFILCILFKYAPVLVGAIVLAFTLRLIL